MSRSYSRGSFARSKGKLCSYKVNVKLKCESFWMRTIILSVLFERRNKGRRYVIVSLLEVQSESLSYNADIFTRGETDCAKIKMDTEIRRTINSTARWYQLYIDNERDETLTSQCTRECKIPLQDIRTERIDKSRTPKTSSPPRIIRFSSSKIRVLNWCPQTSPVRTD